MIVFHDQELLSNRYVCSTQTNILYISGLYVLVSTDKSCLWGSQGAESSNHVVPSRLVTHLMSKYHF